MANLLTMNELCEKLSLSRHTIYIWRKKGMPFLKLDKSIRYDYDEIMKWLIEKGEETK